jgi:transposase
MGKSPKLSQDFRKAIVWFTFSSSYRKTAKLLNISYGAVNRTVNRYRQYGTFKSLPRSGRPRKWELRDERHTLRIITSERFATLRALLARCGLENKVGRHSVLKLLRRHNFRLRRPRRKPFLKPEHKEKRLQWCKDHVHWTVEDWARVIWTDESCFELGRTAPCRYVWRRPGEEFLPECMLPTFKSGRTSVSIWGAITLDVKGPIVFLDQGRMNAQHYINMVLEGPLADFISEMEDATGEDYILMQDNAPCHKAKVCQKAREG